MIRLFKFFLWLTAIAISCLIFSSLLSGLGLGHIAAKVTVIASYGLIIAYSLIFIITVCVLLKSLTRQLANYLHPSSKKSRQIAYLQHKRKRLQHQQMAYRYHIDYTYHSKRSRLKRADNKKQIRSLSIEINKDLRQAKQRISGEVYKQFKTKQRLHTRQQHLEGVIQLHQEIIAKLN